MNPASLSQTSHWKAWRWGLLVMAVTATVWLLCFRHPAVWVMLGIGEPQRPFLDLYALLAAYDAVRQGADPVLPNALDPYNRPFGFSAWWFELLALGWGRKDVLWLGTALLAAGLVTAVGVARPANRLQAALLGLLLVSPATLLSVNRANQDLVILVIVSLGLACFRTSNGTARALAVLLFAVAAVLKYFPLVTLVVLFDFRTRRALLAGAGLYLLVLLLAWPGLEPGLRLLGKYAPTPEWLYAFGAPVLARDFGLQGAVYWLPPAVGLAVWAIWRASRSSAPAPAGLPVSHDSREREFICGAVMLVGTFFLGASYLYKLVFALWMLPWLWTEAAGGTEKRSARFLLCLLLGLAWFEGLAAFGLNWLAGSLPPAVSMGLLKAVLVISQLAAWVLIGCLLRFIVAYLFRGGRAFFAAAPAAP